MSGPSSAFTLGSYYPLHRYRNGVRRIPNGTVHPEDIQVEDYLNETDELFEIHAAAGGDLVWSAAPFWGLPLRIGPRRDTQNPTAGRLRVPVKTAALTDAQWIAYR